MTSRDATFTPIGWVPAAQGGERVQGERRFTDLDEEGLRELLRAVPGMEIASLWATQDNRPDRDETWLNGILRKTAA